MIRGWGRQKVKRCWREVFHSCGGRRSVLNCNCKPASRFMLHGSHVLLFVILGDPHSTREWKLVFQIVLYIIQELSRLDICACGFGILRPFVCWTLGCYKEQVLCSSGRGLHIWRIMFQSSPLDWTRCPWLALNHGTLLSLILEHRTLLNLIHIAGSWDGGWRLITVLSYYYYLLGVWAVRLWRHTYNTRLCHTQ